MIKRVQNISADKRLVNLGEGIVIRSRESYEVNTDTATSELMSKIKSFENLGLIRVFEVEEVAKPEDLGVTGPLETEQKPKPITRTRNKSTKKKEA